MTDFADQVTNIARQAGATRHGTDLPSLVLRLVSDAGPGAMTIAEAAHAYGVKASVIYGWRDKDGWTPCGERLNRGSGRKALEYPRAQVAASAARRGF